MDESNEEKRLTDLCRRMFDLLKTTNVSFWLLEEDGWLHIKEGTGYFREHLKKGESYRFDEGLTGWVFQGHEFVGKREDIEKHPATKYRTKHKIEVQADYYLMLPIPSIFNGGHPIGVFKAEARETDRGSFTEDEKENVKKELEHQNEYFWRLSTAPFAFISYVTKDSKHFVTRLASDLRKKGIRTWCAEENTPKAIRDTITEAIELATHILFVISASSEESSWQKVEISQAHDRFAQDKSLTLIVLRFDNIEVRKVSGVLSDLPRIDFIRPRDYRTGLRRLLKEGFNKSVTSIPSVIPDPKEFFVGRGSEIDKCVDALSEGKHRFVTVVGPAGVGKSTLAARLVYYLRDQSFHQENPPFVSIVYLDVSTVRSKEDFASNIANAFGCRLDFKSKITLEDLRDKLLIRLPHDRQHLLIVDGFECLVNVKGCLYLFYSLTELDPEGPQVLATSRIALRCVDNRFIGKEYLIHLKGLGNREALAYFKRCYSNDDFDAELEQSVVKVMERLDFLPLMIRILAQFNKEEIIKFGTSGINPLSEDLRNLFLESYEHLTIDERRVFVRLCLFGDSFSDVAVQGISAGIDDAKKILNTLKSWHLIEESDLGRYRMLDLLREFSKSLLEDSEALKKLDVTRHQMEDDHVQYYLSFVKQRSHDYATLNEEYANISNVLALLRDSTSSDQLVADTLISFCFALAPYWERRGKWRDAPKYTADCLRVMHQGKPLVRARLLLIHCWSSADLGIYFTDTYKQFIEALAITNGLLSETPDDREIQRLHAKLLQQIGRLIDNCIFELESTVPAHTRCYGVFTRPEQYFEESRRIYEDLGDKESKGGLLRNLGFRSMVCDNLLEAAKFLTDSADIAGSDDPKFGRCLHQMGTVMLKLEDFQSVYDEDTTLKIKECIKPFLSEEVRSLPGALDWAIHLFESAFAEGQKWMEERAKSRSLLQLGVALNRKAFHLADESEKEATKQRAREHMEEALRIATGIGEQKAREKIEKEIDRMNLEKDEMLSFGELEKPVRPNKDALRKALGHTTIKTIFLDVRGTVLSAYDDTEMIADLRQALGECAKRGIHLVIASATSLKSTGMGFVIEPLLREFKERNIGNDYITNCFAYVESGTVAYRFHPEEKITPLEGYEILEFRPREKEVVEKMVQDVCAMHGRKNVRTKPKPGQVNCYAGSPWIERRKIADHLNVRFHEFFGKRNRLIAQVPSARETIDVALCTKRRIAQDYVERVGAIDHEILIIGDSLQFGGNDEPLSEVLPMAISVQVGEIAPENAIFHAKSRGPQGVLDTVRCLLEISPF